MELLNETPFKFAPLVGRVGFPAHSLTLIVKGTFQMVPGQIAQPIEEQQAPTGDEYYPDDEDMQGGCRYESDFAPFKPRADLLLVGKCHAANAAAIRSCQVRFQVETTGKTLGVFGDRLCEPSQQRPRVTEPQPFVEMALRYENSLGGEGFKRNPTGKGYDSTDGRTETVLVLPNIVGSEDRGESPRTQLEPAGFGPLGRTWEHRFSQLGTYDDKWLKQRWPWFPEDLEWGHFNAAPPDMQLEGYLRGDEELEFVNLHPAHSRYRCRLPGLRVRCFLNELTSSGKPRTVFREARMNLDTLWVDMEAEQVVLVWRAVTTVQTQDYDEVQHVFIVSESVSGSPQTTEHHQGMFLERLRAMEDEERESVEPEEPAASDEEGPDSMEEELAAADAERRAALRDAGLDADEDLPAPSEESKAAEVQLLKDLGIREEDEPLTLESVLTRITRRDRFAGEDLTGIDLTQLNAKGINFQGAIIAGGCLKGADLSGADLTEANLAGADLSGALLQGAVLREADLTGANLTEADLTRAVLDGAIVDRATMSRAVLDQATARDASFVGADWSRATARRATFPGADFSQAVLSEADLSGSNLREASIQGAVAVRINLAGADLTELRASEGTDFTAGRFREVIAPESIWETSILRQADFSFARLDRADFTSASLERANFHAASLKWARFLKSNLANATLTRVNLFEGMLERADLTGSDFSGTNLYGAELLDAICDDVRWNSANLKMTKLAPR